MTEKTYNIFDFSIDAGRFAVTGSRREIVAELRDRLDKAVALFEKDIATAEYRELVKLSGLGEDNKIEIQLSAKIVYGSAAVPIAEKRIADYQAEKEQRLAKTSEGGDDTANAA